MHRIAQPLSVLDDSPKVCFYLPHVSDRVIANPQFASHHIAGRLSAAYNTLLAIICIICLPLSSLPAPLPFPLFN